MNVLIILAVLCFGLFARASEDLYAKKSKYYTREQLAEIIHEIDAERIAELHHMNGQQFSQVVKKHGGTGKGKSFIELEMSNQDLIALAAATSLGLIIFKHDQEIMDYVQENKYGIPQSVEDFGNFVGSRAGNGMIMAGSYFLGVVLQDNKLKRVGMISLASGVATALVTEAFKATYGRSRPRENKGPYDFYGDDKSFFSGHTSSIFSIATVFSEVYGKEYPVVPYIAFGVATVTAYARMSSNAHWASDVLAGAIAGILITKVVYHFVNKRFVDNKGNQYLSFYPAYDVRNKGVRVEVNFTPKAWRR